MLGWYLVYCQSRKEATAHAYFERLELGCFYPKIEVEKRKRGKAVKEPAPLFPNYLFVRFDPYLTPIQSILMAPGVATLVKTEGEIRPIETAIVVALRQRLERQSAIETERPAAGDSVRIEEGPFANLDAVFAEPDGEQRSVLLLQVLGQQQRMSFDNQHISLTSKPNK